VEHNVGATVEHNVGATVEHKVLVARMERGFLVGVAGEAGEAQKAHALALVLYQAKRI
tara:strand:- start:306 stop:479 length:174 start_codon:yes stop_codon:yes gene_type:complete